MKNHVAKDLIGAEAVTISPERSAGSIAVATARPGLRAAAVHARCGAGKSPAIRLRSAPDRKAFRRTAIRTAAFRPVRIAHAASGPAASDGGFKAVVRPARRIDHGRPCDPA